MKPIVFPEANGMLEGWTEPPVADLATLTLEDRVISCWRIETPEELAEVNRTGLVWLQCLGHTHPPIAVHGDSPFQTGHFQEEANRPFLNLVAERDRLAARVAELEAMYVRDMDALGKTAADFEAQRDYNAELHDAAMADAAALRQAAFEECTKWEVHHAKKAVEIEKANGFLASIESDKATKSARYWRERGDWFLAAPSPGANMLQRLEAGDALWNALLPILKDAHDGHMLTNIHLPPCVDGVAPVDRFARIEAALESAIDDARRVLREARKEVGT